MAPILQPSWSRTRAKIDPLILVAMGAFATLYPAFFLYHFAVGKTWIPPVLMGLYGPATLIILPFALIAIFANIRRLLNNLVGALFILLYVYAVIWVSILGYALPSSHLPNAVNIQYLSLLVSWATLFFTGLYLSFKEKFFERVVLAGWAIMGLIVLTNIDTSYAMFAYRDSTSPEVASYQGMARSFFFTSLYLVAVMRRGLLYLGLPTFVVLFLIGARSEMISFVCVVAALVVLHSRKRPAVSIGAVVAGSAASAWFLTSAQMNISSRQLLIFDLGGDTSWNSRQAMTEFAAQQIYENPIVGVYGGHYLYGFGGLGSGAHNILSVWVDFGAIGMLLYSALILIAVVVSWRLAIQRPLDPQSSFCFIGAVAVVVLVLFSKDVFWAEPALIWGVVVASLLRGVRPPVPVARHNPSKARYAA